jgi:Skp family chaperone for outer membrane proteins
MKTIVKGVLCVALLGMAGQAMALRVAYVDIKKVFDGYEGTQAAKEKLKKEADGEKEKLEKDQDKLKKKLDDLQSQKKVLAEAKYAEKEQAIMGEIRQLQGQIQTVQNDLSGQEQKLTEQILEEIREKVQKVADREKYEYVFEKSTLLFGGTEITASVLKELNSK